MAHPEHDDEPRQTAPPTVLAFVGGFLGGLILAGSTCGVVTYRIISPMMDPQSMGPLMGFWLIAIAGIVAPSIALVGGAMGGWFSARTCARSGKLPLFSTLGFIAAVLAALWLALDSATGS